MELFRVRAVDFILITPVESRKFGKKVQKEIHTVEDAGNSLLKNKKFQKARSVENAFETYYKKILINEFVKSLKVRIIIISWDISQIAI